MAAEATEDMSSRGNAVKVVQSPETALELKQLTWSKVGREPMSAALNKKRDPRWHLLPQETEVYPHCFT